MGTYEQLVHAIREARAASQERIDQAIDQEKVREAWEIGQLIDAHILQHKERADYGTQVIKRLAGDLKMDRTELYRMLEFARTYPIVAPAQPLSWGHYRELIYLKDPVKRKELAEKASEEKWTRARLRSELQGIREASSVVRDEALSEIPLTAEPGKLFTYRVVKAAAGPLKGQLALDLGLSIYFQPEKIGKFKAGDMVTLEKGKLKRISGGAGGLFTYTAYVTQIIDGDTFKAVVDLGFDIATVQTLRLGGLDAPEIESREGREAKAFLEKRLTETSAPVLIKTAKSDKYDRYLVDVFVDGRSVNQELLDKNLAERMPS